MRIKITSTHVEEKKWTKGERSGVIRTQEATAENEHFRQRVRLDLGKEDAYPVGDYEFDFEASVRVGDFGDIALARKPVLRKIAAAAAPKAA